jgi:hypothetical protein
MGGTLAGRELKVFPPAKGVACVEKMNRSDPHCLQSALGWLRRTSWITGPLFVNVYIEQMASKDDRNPEKKNESCLFYSAHVHGQPGFTR